MNVRIFFSRVCLGLLQLLITKQCKLQLSKHRDNIEEHSDLSSNEIEKELYHESTSQGMCS